MRNILILLIGLIRYSKEGKSMIDFEKKFENCKKTVQKAAPETIIINSNYLTINIMCTEQTLASEFTQLKLALKKVLHCKKTTDNLISYFVDMKEETQNTIDKFLSSMELTETEEVKIYNQATNNKTFAKCDSSKKFVAIVFDCGLKVIINRKTCECITYVSNNEEALTMLYVFLVCPLVLTGDLYVAHAGLVSKKKQNILLYNDSLGGKTSFGFLFLSHGWEIIAEDAVYFDKNGQVIDFLFRKYFHVRAGTYAYFQDLLENTNKKSLSPSEKERLFDIKKSDQKTIPYSSICSRQQIRKKIVITDCMMINIDKMQKYNEIKKLSTDKLICNIVELCNMPTINIFKFLFPGLPKISMEQQRMQLRKCMKRTNSYCINVGLEYKDYYEEIINYMM